jgi:peptidyl-tRNA hydrolase, PTH1 family
MKIIACLGNPGDRYRNTRHNVGFLVGKYLADHYSIPVTKKGFSSIYGTGRSGVHDILLIFPQTFMNMSGTSINAALSFYKEDASSLIVIHDEIELPFGEIRKKNGGGHKGHNGLRSIIQNVGTNDFLRIRFGVGRPDEKMDVSDYVLSAFSSEEYGKLDPLFIRAREELEGLLG